jgi:hypothetical protein
MQYQKESFPYELAKNITIELIINRGLSALWKRLPLSCPCEKLASKSVILNLKYVYFMCIYRKQDLCTLTFYLCLFGDNYCSVHYTMSSSNIRLPVDIGRKGCKV